MKKSQNVIFVSVLTSLPCQRKRQILDSSLLPSYMHMFNSLLENWGLTLRMIC